jgi:fibro-slime domain-containing protein
MVDGEKAINNHNFGFTSHVSGKFEYSGSEEFYVVGDDDIYLFINGKLVADLGGLHTSLCAKIDLANGKVTGGDMKGDDIYACPEENEQDISSVVNSLTENEIYSYDLFHAERQKNRQ